MKFKIFTDDCGTIGYFIVEADTIEEVKKLAIEGVTRRGWKNYWSEEL